MVSLDQNELIDVIVLALQAIHHNIILFCNISWMWTEYKNNITYMQFWCTHNYFYVIYSHFGYDVIIHWMNYIFLVMGTTDTSVIPTECFFQLKIHEMEIEMKMIPIISFSIDAICVSYIIIRIFKFIFSLINFMAIISDINMWLWQWLKSIHVLSTLVIEIPLFNNFYLFSML